MTSKSESSGNQGGEGLNPEETADVLSEVAALLEPMPVSTLPMTLCTLKAWTSPVEIPRGTMLRTLSS